VIFKETADCAANRRLLHLRRYVEFNAELCSGLLTEDKVVAARGFHKLLHTEACAAQVSSGGDPDGSVKFVELKDIERL
jgi:hypothetical protein